jgi:hypothetical protein
MFWSTLMTLLLVMACAMTPGWISFIAIRVIQGFFSPAAQVLGLTAIDEIWCPITLCLSIILGCAGVNLKNM